MAEEELASSHWSLALLSREMVYSTAGRCSGTHMRGPESHCHTGASEVEESHRRMDRRTDGMQTGRAGPLQLLLPLSTNMALSPEQVGAGEAELRELS